MNGAAGDEQPGEDDERLVCLAQHQGHHAGDVKQHRHLEQVGEVPLRRDDGVGLPDIALGGQDGLGMQIAAIISAELQGDLNIQSSEGEGLTIGIEFVSAAG